MTETTVILEKQDEKLEREMSFIKQLANEDKGRLAVLRRNAGNSFKEAKGAVAWLYGLSQRYSGQYGEETCFLIATLFASDKDAIKDEMEHRNRSTGNFGSTLRSLRTKLLIESGKLPSDSSPLDRRFNALLDADFDPNNGGELVFRLRQMTKRIITAKDRSIRINWPQLLHDIRLWSYETKRIQKEWARSYYAPSLDSPENTDSQILTNEKEEEK